MKYKNHIVIERPLEKVFFWMFQPQHIIQLVTMDHTKEFETNEPIPSHLIERAAEARRFREQAETEFEIQNLSHPTLRSGATFQYKTGVRSRSEEFPAWTPVNSGSITIKKSTPSTFFAFKQRGPSYNRDHSLTFQAQQDTTLMTYNQSSRSGTIGLLIASVVMPTVVSLGEEVVQQQLKYLKAQMEAEIN